jgi:uncharacterized repeat protein (TIGR03837 family)
MSAPRSWDVFCHVVDNFGDAAVCWRLAQRLAAADHVPTRLWIDNLSVLRALRPEMGIDLARQMLAGVEICHWTPDADFGQPADVAVDAFGGGLPEDYAQAMAARLPRTLWVVLEYLSAEPWVASHHGLPSPHPRLPLDRYFFFPGFGPGTGGLLREPGLGERRRAYLTDPFLGRELWLQAGFPPLEQGTTLVSLFGYENDAVAELLEAWATGADPVVAAIPQSRLSTQAAAHFGLFTVPAGKTICRGRLEARFMPFLAQERYDALLWAADWNFVRGEDSFVRAQWAERPFVWHIYPQAEGAHLAKLDAFLGAYCSALVAGAAKPLGTLWRAWNHVGNSPDGSIGGAWRELSGRGPVFCEHAHVWAQKLAAAGDLAENLAKFCADRLK